jgi:hypothetical protein
MGVAALNPSCILKFLPRMQQRIAELLTRVEANDA